MMKMLETIGDQLGALINTGQPVLITAVSHRLIPYLKNIVGQVTPQALPDNLRVCQGFVRELASLAP